MRDRTAIEREIFNARADLEENIDRLMRKAREKLAVRARARHAVPEFAREYPNVITVCVIVCVIALLFVQRARRRAPA
jgi:hypothetical protein